MPGEIVTEITRERCGRNETALAGQLPQELAFVHVVLEGFAAVDEDDGDFVVVLTAEFRVFVNIDFQPSEAAVARELGQALFHHFAQVTALAGIDDDTTRLWHAGRILAQGNGGFPA